MSHLLYNSFQRPYAFELPRVPQPLTPPDTDNESPAPAQTPASAAIPSASDVEGLVPQPFQTLGESPVPLGRRGPSVTYINSGLRESRERVVQRGPKWLVVVIPPPSFSRERGHLGHTLSSGPRDRLSHGILMPLFYTMGGQLSAIAREFGLPSSAGLCIYLRTNQSGLHLTPRISDESWQLLWAHLFEARSPTIPLQQLPISGQIEFDIDMTKARWYDTWLAAYRKDTVDVPYSVTHSRHQSASHWRGDSGATTLEDNQLDGSLSQQTGTVARIAPKKLSLLDRFETASVPRAPRLLSPPSPNELNIFHALSPIVQEADSPNPKKNVDSLVNSWRVGASLSQSPLALTGQTSLDPANMPNTVDDLPTGSPAYDAQAELDLDEYTWSISSAGPPEYDETDSVISWLYAQSVHLDRRLEGSVCLTPSTCTSFGPPDDDYQYSLPSTRLPSPDIALRALSDAPPTPSICTSYGPPDDDFHLHSYTPSERLPSPDLGLRALDHAPITPSVCTSFGPPDDDYHWSMPSTRLPSPDIGRRVLDDVPLTPSVMDVSAPQEDHEGSIWSHVWPYCVERDAAGVFAPDTRHKWEDAHAQVSHASQAVPWSGVCATSPHVPLTEMETSFRYPFLRIYPVAYPFFELYPVLPHTANDVHTAYFAVGQNVRENTPITMGPSSSRYPYFTLYPAVYPFFDLYPAVAGGVSRSAMRSDCEPGSNTVPWKQVWPYIERAEPQAAPWTQVVPFAESSAPASTSASAKVEPWQQVWPYAGSCQAAKPQTEPWTQVWPYAASAANSRAEAWMQVGPYEQTAAEPKSARWKQTRPYEESAVEPKAPAWKQVWPYRRAAAALQQAETWQQVWPYERTAAEAKVEPWKQVWPYQQAAAESKTEPWKQVFSYTEVADESKAAVSKQVFQSVKSAEAKAAPWRQVWPYVGPLTPHAAPWTQIWPYTNYPAVVLYPAVYPFLDLYPAISHSVAADRNLLKEVSVELRGEYPALQIYRPMYPHLVIYPAVGPPVANSLRRRITLNLLPCLSSTYPVIQPYPPVYPWNLVEIYPSSSVAEDGKLSSTLAVDVQLEAHYPSFLLYHPVYPHNLHFIYPLSSPREAAWIGHSTFSHSAVFDMAPIAVGAHVQYPHFNIYPQVGMLSAGGQPQNSKRGESSSTICYLTDISIHYPLIILYPAVYPWNLDGIYPASNSTASTSVASISVSLKSHYPHIRLYPATYPENLDEIYPPVTSASIQEQATSVSSTIAISVKLLVAYPFFNLYPAVYPHSIVEIYPNYKLDSELQVSPRSQVAGLSTALESQYPTIVIYPSVYPFLDVYPSVRVGIVQPVVQARSVPRIAVTQTGTPRRRPTLSHKDLHRQVFSSGFVAREDIPTQDPVLKENPAPQQSAPAPAPRTRSRSGTISRPLSLAQPMTGAAMAPPPVSRSRAPSIIAESSPVANGVSLAQSTTGATIAPPPVSRRSRAPSIIGQPSPPVNNVSAQPPAFNGLTSQPAATRVSPTRAVGLPSHPAMKRRLSSAIARPVSSSFSPLPAVIEPDHLHDSDEVEDATETATSTTMDGRNVPRPIGLPPRTLEVHESQSATLPDRPQLLGVGAELSRAKTLPSKGASLRIKRTNSVLEKARAFDKSRVTGEDPHSSARITMSTLAQFPSPPRPPLPTEPNGKLVSKLDRSKYPFM